MSTEDKAKMEAEACERKLEGGTSARLRRTRPVVAIDGPAGAGKSTVTRRVAAELGYTKVDTGALYRTVALLALEAGGALEDESSLFALCQRLLADGALVMSSAAEGTRLLVFGQDVSQRIREQKVGLAASVVSSVPVVRQALLGMQRQLGKEGGVVLEGRDIGTVVFPDAEVKFFLTASPEVRASRRRDELLQKGESPVFEQVLAEVIERDRRDSERSVAPLCQADDALLVDSSTLSLDEVVSLMVGQVREREAQLKKAHGG